MSDSQHIDSAMLDQLKELLEDRFSELVTRFVDDGSNRMALLKSALPSTNFDVIYAEAHGLKGSSRNIGAGPLGELCAQLESLGKAQSSEGMEQIFAAIEQEFAVVCETLKAY